MKLRFKTTSLLLLILLVSCAKDKDPDPEPVTGANILGGVNLFNEGVIQADNSGMTVKVDGSSPTIAATTGQDGEFTLEEVPFGTYTLVFEKPGYGTFKLFNLEHTNTGSSTVIAQRPSLGQVSTTEITELTTTLDGNDVEVNVTSNPGGNAGNRRYLRFFYSDNANVSDKNYTYHSEVIISQINPYVLNLSPGDLSEMGFSSGASVFVKVYGDSFWSNAYDDPDLGKKVFPNLNTNSANAVSFVVP